MKTRLLDFRAQNGYQLHDVTCLAPSVWCCYVGKATRSWGIDRPTDFWKTDAGAFSLVSGDAGLAGEAERCWTPLQDSALGYGHVRPCGTSFFDLHLLLSMLVSVNGSTTLAPQMRKRLQKGRGCKMTFTLLWPGCLERDLSKSKEHQALQSADKFWL